MIFQQYGGAVFIISTACTDTFSFSCSSYLHECNHAFASGGQHAGKCDVSCNYCTGDGSGKFTRVHFKNNTATDVSNLLSLTIFTILERRNLVKSKNVYK